MIISEQKFIQYLALMGAMFMVIGFVSGRWTATPEIKTEYVTKTRTEVKIVRQFVTSNVERECLAQAIYSESRSESQLGQLAVGSVIMNRVSDNRYPDTICGVVEYKNKGVYHFSYQYRKDPNFYHTARVFANMQVSAIELEAREKAYEVADKILDGERNLPETSLNYHSTAVSPDWAKDLTFYKQIGLHKYYTGF